MNVLPYKNTRRIIIDPGEYYVSNQNEIISTLLGSCVAACLYDPVNKIIGMNHFLLAYLHHSQIRPILETDEGRYGLYAMELLINAMMKNGARKNNLKAKCFGGGNVLRVLSDVTEKKTIGEVNIEFIKAFLRNEKIPMVCSSMGGNIGRHVHFVGGDFSVYVKSIESAQIQKLEKRERRYWQKNIDAYTQEQSSPIEYW